MQEQAITTYHKIRRAPNSSREVLGTLFRHRRLMTFTFLATFAVAVLATVLFGIKYEAHTEFLVKQQRPSELVTTQENAGSHPISDEARAREINTEVQLIESDDILEEVVRASHLDNTSQKGSWTSRLEFWKKPQAGTAESVRALRSKLQVETVPDSNMIRVKYRSRNPEQAAEVLRNLDTFYIAKHIAVFRAPGAYKFFQAQTERYQKELNDAEARLASFDLQQKAAAPDLERNILLQKASDFRADVAEARSEISETQKRIHVLNKELASTPERLQTQYTTAQNPQLLANLKSTLQDLEVKRTDLLEKYQPDYQPVKEIEKQIAQVQASIAAAHKNPLHQNTTDQNPTYQMLQSEMAKAHTQLAALRAKVAATAPVVSTYSKDALLLDQKHIKRQDLLRSVKTSEQNYLLYLHKGEQARISDALDKRRILNVAVAEAATVPSLPVNSPVLLILAGGILAFLVSTAAAFVADYFDPSFRTPDEVFRYLDMPVLAAFPKNGHAPRFALSSGSAQRWMTDSGSLNRKIPQEHDQGV